MSGFPVCYLGPTMKVKRSIVEKRLLIKRSEEELPLLVREMRDHVNYYKYQVLPQLEACEVKIFDKIQDISRKLKNRLFLTYPS